jgi:hypothetical protein
VGGDGATGGGSGGDVFSYANYGGVIANATLRSFGGNALTSGNGGNGGYWYPEVWGAVRQTGSVDTHGGNGAGTGNGGSGGHLTFDLYYDRTWNGDTAPNTNALWFGASVNASGGAGAAGGAGGYFYVNQEANHDYNDPLSAPPLVLVGFSTIDVSGGDGATAGGSAGGDNYLESWASSYDTNGDYIAGTVVNEANWLLKGGASSGGSGGSGAYLYFETVNNAYPSYDYGVKNTGSIDASGGQGSTFGGSGGYIKLFGEYHVDSSGNLDVSGGAGGTGSGGGPGSIYLTSNKAMTCSGNVLANGGGSASSGGTNGGYVELTAESVATVRGAVSVNGGSSTSGTAGSGGEIWILGQENGSAVSAALTASKGTGAGSPTNGTAYVDGFQAVGP